MAVKARTNITLSFIVDIKASYRYYKLLSSTEAVPSKPTANPPGDDWGDTEPSYTTGSTNTLYTVDLTIFSDDTFSYSSVSKSSSYEAAKEAYNKATAAQNSAGAAYEASQKITPFIIGTQTAVTGTWTGIAPFQVLADGQQITYWLPFNGSGNATLNLTLSNGTTTGNVNCYFKGISRLTTHYTAGSCIRLTYRYNTTVSGGTTQYTGWWADANFYSDNDYNERYYGGVIANSSITGYSLIAGHEGKYNSLTASGVFDITYPILYYGSSSAISAGGSVSKSSLYSGYVDVDLRNTLTGWSGTVNSFIFLKGTLNNCLFTLASSDWLTCTVPTENDGCVYMLLGECSKSSDYTSNCYLRLHNTHQIYKWFKNGFKSFEQIAIEAQTDIDGTKQDLTDNYASKTYVDDTGDAISSRVDTIDTRTGVLETSVSLKVNRDEIKGMVTDITSEGVVTESAVLDKDGFTVDRTGSKTKSTLNEEGIKVIDKTASLENQLFFAGVKDGKAVVETEFIKVKSYADIGNNSRIQDYDTTRTGIFFIG